MRTLRPNRTLTDTMSSRREGEEEEILLSAQQSSIYLDEEECLPFKIWVAELELLLSQSRSAKAASGISRTKSSIAASFGPYYMLLQKLEATVDTTGVAEVKEHQRRCEDALVDILLSGAPPPVRRLICGILGKMYAVGDSLPLYSRVSSLQLFLGTKEAFGSRTSEDIRLGALELMTTLYYSHGKSLTVGVLETSSIAIKYCSRTCSSGTRKAGLKLLAATVEGVGDMHREATQVQIGALKCIERMVAKEKHTLDCTIKLGIADVLRAIAAVVPLESWLDGSLSALNVDSVRSMCLMGLRDEGLQNTAVRYAFARALGELVARIYTAGGAYEDGGGEEDGEGGKSGTDATSDWKYRPGIVAENVELSLMVPMAEALMAEDRLTCIALSQAWVSFLTKVTVYVEDRDGSFDSRMLLELSKGPLVAARVASATSSGGMFVERGVHQSMDVGLGASVSSGDRPFSQACVTYVLRCGIVEQMGERGQQELLLSLSRALATGLTNKEFTPSLAMAQLNIISHLIELLGEIGEERAEPVEQALALCFVSESAAVRQHAGPVLAALAISESGRAAKLFGSSLSSLKNAADALVDASSNVPDKGKPQTHGVPRWAGTAKFGKEIDAVHGWALATACLVAATPSLPLGIPSHYVRVACQIAAALIESPRCEHPGARCVELEAGYLILGALCKHAPDVLASVYGDSVLKMWLPMFSDGSLELMRKVAQSKDEQALAAELWWRSESLHALGAYYQSALRCMGDAERQALSDFLGAAFRVVSENATVLRPTEVVSRGGFSQLQGAAALFQIRLLRLMCVAPQQLWDDADLVTAVSTVCVEGLTGSAMGLSSVAGLRTFLSSILDLEEDVMRRVFSSKDIFERDLLQFSGASGGIERELWSLRASCDHQGYPQPLSLSDALNLARSQFLAHSIRVGKPEQANAAVARLCGLPATVKKDKTGVKKLALGIVASCPVILATKSSLATNASNNANSSPSKYNAKLSQESVNLVTELAEELSTNSSQGMWVQATVLELYGSLSQATSGQQSHQLMSALCGKSVSTASLDQRATFVLSIGSTSRGIGGLGLTALLPQIVQTLIALGRASPSSIAPFVADALSTVSTSSGPSFLPYVKDTLDVVQEMLLDEDIYSTPGLLPSIGQLGNAMVACLGPDYILGSNAYDVCRSIVSELRAPDPCGVRLKEDILTGALQSVLYAQMLVLFVPKALTTAQHVKVLVDTLPSRQPYLRRAAADTLRHLAERETEKVLKLRVEGALLQALDGETDRGAADQLKAAIKVLLVNGSRSKPCSWLRLLGDVATGTAFNDLVAKKGRPLVTFPSSAGGLLDEEYTGSNDSPDTNGTNIAPNSIRAAPEAIVVARRHMHAAAGMPVSPRLRTRIFAANCLIMVPSLAIKANKAHADAILSEKRPGEWLASSAESLVDIGFKLASGDADGLRSRGVKLLAETLDALGGSRDPLDRDELLMLQYQAQYVSALRGSLSKGASPAVNAAGCSLVALFLEKGMAASDKILLERLLALLCEPLSAWSSGSTDSTQNAYAEWVAAGARAALLESHALCATLDIHSPALSLSPGADSHNIPYKEIVSRAHGPFYTILVECWTGLLEDAIVLFQGDPSKQKRHILQLYGRLGSAKAPTLASARQGISKIIDTAWPTILDASTLVMSRDRTVSHGDSGRSRFLSLFDITVNMARSAQCSQMVDSAGLIETGLVAPGSVSSKGSLAVVRSLSRLTDVRYASDGWLDRDMVAQAAAIALDLMRQHASPVASSSPSMSLDTVELGALVIQNAMECTAMNHGPGELESRMAWALECVQLAATSSPTCLETALDTLRVVLSTLINQSAAVEEIVYCLFGAMKCGFELTRTDPSVRTASLVYGHIIETARIVGAHPALAAATSMDPNIPSIEDIFTSTASEACTSILGDANAQTPAPTESLAKVILVVGHMSSSSCQDACIETLEACLGGGSDLNSDDPDDLQQQVLKAIEAWLDDQPDPQWANRCGHAIFPNVVRELYALTSDSGASPSSLPSMEATLGPPLTQPTHDTVTSMVRICATYCQINPANPTFIRSAIPPIVRLVADAPPTSPIRPACAAAMLSLARGPAAADFKSVIKALPEELRVKLHDVLASGSGDSGGTGAYTAQRSASRAGIGIGQPPGGTLTKGLQGLDLNRFK